MQVFTLNSYGETVRNMIHAKDLVPQTTSETSYTIFASLRGIGLLTKEITQQIKERNEDINYTSVKSIYVYIK